MCYFLTRRLIVADNQTLMKSLFSLVTDIKRNELISKFSDLVMTTEIKTLFLLSLSYPDRVPIV